MRAQTGSGSPGVSRTSRSHRRAAALAAGAVVVLGLSGCGTAQEDSTEDRTLRVYAAASLTESFEDLAQEFEAEHPGVNVELNFAGSSTLVTQLEDGATADVFASADEANMTKAEDAGLVDGKPSIFATNELTIAVPVGNPAGVHSFEDLDEDGLSLVICEQRVPCGAATQRLEENTGTTLAPVSEESAVTDVMGKVTAGEADAGVVYKTDVKAAGDAVEEVPISQSGQAVNNYPIAVLRGSQESELAGEFMALVQGERGQERLAEEGFGAP